MCLSVALNSFGRSHNENIELSHATHPPEGFFSAVYVSLAAAWSQTRYTDGYFSNSRAGRGQRKELFLLSQNPKLLP